MIVMTSSLFFHSENTGSIVLRLVPGARFVQVLETGFLHQIRPQAEEVRADWLTYSVTQQTDFHFHHVVTVVVESSHSSPVLDPS
jgi:hypothetical protein